MVRELRGLLLLCMTIAWLLFLPSVASGSETLKKVIILSSEDPNVRAIVLVNESIRNTLKRELPVRVQFYNEALDSFRIPNDKYEDEMVRLLQRKYDGQQIDLIYALGEPALKFLLKHRSEFNPTTPILFALQDQSRLENLNPGPDVTGVWGRYEMVPTLELALKLQPDTQQVTVIAGSSTLEKIRFAEAQRDFRPYEGKVKFIYLTGLPLQEIQKQVASQPPKSIIIFLAYLVDSTGTAYNDEAFNLIVPLANAPVYGMTQIYMGNSFVGGILINYEVIGQRVARMGLRVLSGERPQDIPRETVPSVPMVDWRQLRRFGIDESKLPQGSIVLFKQPTFWEQYKWRLVAIISLCVLEALLIIGLLISRERRRRAEEASKASEERYRNVVDTQTELICRYLPDSTLTFVNDAYCRYFGKTRSQLVGTKFLDLIPEHAQESARKHIASLFEHRHMVTNEQEVLLPGGAKAWQQWYDYVVRGVNTNGDLEVQGIGRDITERRLAEEALRASETRFRNLADSAPLMIWMAGPDKICTYLNQGWLEFTGRTLDQELKDGWSKSVHEDDYASCMEAYESAFDRREAFRIEFRLRRADGVFRWIYSSGTPRVSCEGEFLGYIGSCIDIADRKEAEEALRQAHQEVSKLKNQLEAENVYLQEEIKLVHNFDEIVGESNAIKYVLFKVEQVSKTDSTVLILGETGTGKELVARAIHNQSRRNDRPLVKLNCAALSPSLIESELFGHEKGAFTGATARKIGRFELADGATLFLDEIGELPLESQSKLLRVVQEGELERLGGTKTIKVNVRLLAATSRNLKAEVKRGKFREDLWYRLNIFPITMPPLQQRKEDVPLLIEHFVSKFNKKLGRSITSVSSLTMRKLQDYSWPGNVRELANVVERAVINSQGTVLQLPDGLEEMSVKPPVDGLRTLDEMEREYIIRILDNTSWRIEGPQGAARILGLNPSTLRTRMVKLGIQRRLRTYAATAGSTG